MPFTPVEKFGKDHWSMFAYIETLCVDGRDGLGVIDPRKCRINPERHPNMGGAGLWKDEYSTRLRGFFDFPDRADPAKAEEAGVMIVGHDDIDCLEDLDEAGLVSYITLTSGGVVMTEKGMEVAGKLRTHKASGGNFSGFVLDQVKKTSPRTKP